MRARMRCAPARCSRISAHLPCTTHAPLPPSTAGPLQVYTDMLTAVEYFSDAKVLEPVMWKDETGEEIDTGLLRCKAVKQTQGGVKLAGVGGSGAGAGFGGEKAEDDEGGGDDGEEAEETKCVLPFVPVCCGVGFFFFFLFFSSWDLP